jgi:hypothetical protein
MYISNQITSQIAVPWGIYLQHTGGKSSLLLGTYDQNGSTATATFTMPDLSGYTIDNSSYIEFRMLNISTGVVLPDNLTFECSNFKIEHGSIFTGYEPTPYAQDERECMKWYNRSVGDRWPGNPRHTTNESLVREAKINFPVPMYSKPTVTITSNSAWSPSAPTSLTSSQGFSCEGDTDGPGLGTWITSYTASCEL